MGAQGHRGAAQLDDAGLLRGSSSGVLRRAPRLGALVKGGGRLRQIGAVHQRKERRLGTRNIVCPRLCSKFHTLAPMQNQLPMSKSLFFEFKCSMLLADLKPHVDEGRSS